MLNVELLRLAAMWNWPMMNFDALTRCFEHEIRRRPTDRREVITRMTRIICTRILLCLFIRTRISPITRMHVRVGTLTWCLLNENDTNEIKTDPIRGVVNTNCLRLVLEIKSFNTFSPLNNLKASFHCILAYRKSSKSSLLYINQMFKIQQRRDFFLI